MIQPTRRAVLGLLGAPLALVPAAARPSDSLHERARRRGLSFGAALDTAGLRDDAFRAALLQECGSLVATWEMKWGWTEPARGRHQYEAGDALAAFAAQHGLPLRGHAAVWHQNLPAWVPAALRAEGLGVVEARVREIMGRYAGRIGDWDVVNEAVEPRHGRADGLRVSALLDALGPAYIAASFRAARAADPKARLVYNDYDLETATPSAAARRRAVLALLTNLRREGLVDALGIQSHLRPDLPFDAGLFRRFLAEVAALGLGIVLTELDVIDAKLPADVAGRDAAAAAYLGRYLDTALDERAVTDVVAWGLSDRYTYVDNDPNTRRADGSRGRPLPLDEALTRKPLWTAIATSLDHAPDRRRTRTSALIVQHLHRTVQGCRLSAVWRRTGSVAWRTRPWWRAADASRSTLCSQTLIDLSTGPGTTNDLVRHRLPPVHRHRVGALSPSSGPGGLVGVDRFAVIRATARRARPTATYEIGIAGSASSQSCILAR